MPTDRPSFGKYYKYYQLDNLHLHFKQFKSSTKTDFGQLKKNFFSKHPKHVIDIEYSTDLHFYSKLTYYHHSQ